METGSAYRPRVSRETRLLLTAGVLAVAALWLLARIRFPERPATPNPVPAVLSQLASGPKYQTTSLQRSHSSKLACTPRCSRSRFRQLSLALRRPRIGQRQSGSATIWR